MDSTPPAAVPIPHKASTVDQSLILGVVLGVVGLIICTAVAVFYIQHRRRMNAKRTKPIPPSDGSKTGDGLLQQLKEQEFDCHDIDICLDQSGSEIQLGAGGFGRVIKGVRDGVQPVAIKMILKTDQKAQEDFLKEIKLLKHVSLDANVVQYFGASFQHDQLWLVTEYMEGGDLRKALTADDDNRLTWWNGGKQVALDVARGLAFLHSRHVIHRDIKSHNILLTREGRAKIADVGMAQIMSEDYYACSLTSQQGTFAWASPELLLREGRCTEKVDIYSFGVCLWEIVTSLMPKRGEMFCPSPEECPPAVTRLIQECMRRNPRDRPSAREIHRRLQACEPISEDCEQLILDSAEAGGRGSRVILKAQQGQAHTSYKLEPASGGRPAHSKGRFPYDSPMSTHQEAIKASPIICKLPGEESGPPTPSDIPLPTSNAAFTQLVAKYSQPMSSTMAASVHSAMEDIMATTPSVDADLSHIPSVHDSMTQDRMRLPDFVLTTDDSRYMDFTRTTSSEDLFTARTGLTSHNLSLTLPPRFTQTQSSDELFTARRLSQLGATGEIAKESEYEEEDDTCDCAEASVHAYAGSCHASRLNTGSQVSGLNTGSSCGDAIGKELEKLADRAGVIAENMGAIMALPRITVIPQAFTMFPQPIVFPQQPTEAKLNTGGTNSIHTGNSLHTGSTGFYEDAVEHHPWEKAEEAQIDGTNASYNIMVNTGCD